MDCEIHYITKNKFKGLVEHNPHIDQILGIEDRVSELETELKNGAYDYVIDLHNNIRSRQVSRITGALTFMVDKINWQKWLLVNFKIDRLPKKHIVDRYLDTLSAFRIQNDGNGLDYFPNPNTSMDVKQRFGVSGGYIAMAIGGQKKGKIMPYKKLAKIAIELSKPVVLLGGPEDSENARKIKALAGEGVHDACGQLSLDESALVVKQADALITHDTGLMHIASAYKKKVISIWGCTVPELGMSPYHPGEGSKIVEVKGLPSRPCSKLGTGTCKDFACMNLIDEHDVLDGAS